jgi:hypothetical protein
VKCKFTSFDRSTTIDKALCTGCLLGLFINKQGKCVKSCPLNTFIPENSTMCTGMVFFFIVFMFRYRLQLVVCIDCMSPCSSCAGAPDYCLSCTNGMLASSGKCVKKCPQGTYLSNKKACRPCHPDCKACKGPSYAECSSCRKTLPVLKSGRCLASCSSNEFFNWTTWTCQKCDPSCATCNGGGRAECTSCPKPFTLVIRGVCTPVPRLVLPLPA